MGTLTQNIKDILHETDQILPAGSSETVVQNSNATSTSGIGVQPQSAGSKKYNTKPGGIENSPIPSTMQEGGTTVTRTSTYREAAAGDCQSRERHYYRARYRQAA
ncbi:MAG: hypothetical protein WDM70_09360 [Nitrosomonadales bacterium]